MDPLPRPPGWPVAVRAPGAPQWEESAQRWLLDVSPPEYRTYPALRRHLLLLARFARLHVEGMQATCRRGLSEARGELRGVAPPAVVDAAVSTWAAEEARLMALAREVALVEDALRGARYRARL